MKGKYPRKDLLINPRLRQLAESRDLQGLLQGLVLAIYFFLVIAGLFGTQIPRFNISTVGVWTIWWTGIIFLILFFGKAWCYLCPWNTAVGWIKKAGFAEPGLLWPKKLKNLYPAAAFLGLITWLELGASITYSPRYTAYLMIVLFIVAVLIGVAFKKRIFCQYLCFIGAIQGIYSTVSPVELRNRDRETCFNCRTKDCIRGNEKGEGCPVELYPGGMERSITSITCMECLRICPYHNMSIFVRPFGAELTRIRKPKMDEAVFISTLLGLTLFHGFTMLSSWADFGGTLGRAVYYGVFTLLLAASVALPIGALYTVSSFASRGLDTQAGPRLAFKAFAYALVPVALFYHLAHNSMHLLMEGPAVLPLISDPMGVGWDLFGTRGRAVSPLLSMDSMRVLQVAILLIGLLFSLKVALQAAEEVSGGKSRLSLSFLILAVLILGAVGLSLWLLYQPMVMRIT